MLSNLLITMRRFLLPPGTCAPLALLLSMCSPSLEAALPSSLCHQKTSTWWRGCCHSPAVSCSCTIFMASTGG